MFNRILSPHLLSVAAVTYRRLGISAACSAKKIVEKADGNVTVVELENVKEPENPKFDAGGHKCALCAIPVKIKYTDVLILEQFMREDGTVLPKELTGLCTKQQLRLERCVMQAHWSGLFPDRTLPDFDRAGYKRFSRYWDDDMDIYKTDIKIKPGVFFYVNKYLPRGALFKQKKETSEVTSAT